MLTQADSHIIKYDMIVSLPDIVAESDRIQIKITGERGSDASHDQSGKIFPRTALVNAFRPKETTLVGKVGICICGGGKGSIEGLDPSDGAEL